MQDLTLPQEDGARLRLSPTDISQFVRLDQCERYLRLRLYERLHGQRFLYDEGVAPQSLPPLLTRSGRAFEERLEAAIAQTMPAVHLAAEAAQAGQREDDNARVLREACRLALGGTLALFQPRLRVDLDGWRLTGDADLLRLHRRHDGSLDLLVADLKSSTQAKVEHRLQVAFYHTILARLLEDAGMPCAGLRTGILYQGPAEGESGRAPEEAERLRVDRDAAGRLLGIQTAYLELPDAPEAYLESVADLVTGPESTARRVARTAFADLRFHLCHKCDGCLYNELCLKWSAERDDLSLLPHLSAAEKAALKRAGLHSVSDLAYLKEPGPGKQELQRRAATTWPVGPRLDELILRARRYRRWKGDDLEAPPTYLEGKGYGTLPCCDADHNPNLVRVCIDAQHDYLTDRIYLLGSLVVACREGQPVRRRAVVHMTPQPPASAEAERRLFVAWIRDTLRAVVELAEPDEAGERRAPVHLVFYDALEQRLLLEGLARHLSSLAGAAPALYDFATQLAAFDSPIATFLSDEIRELRNFPMLCQSLQSVAAYLGFRWDEEEPYTRIFRERLFDMWRKMEGSEAEAGEAARPWYTGRSRFSSAIPLEYAYAAWGELEEPPPGGRDDYAAYRVATPDLLRRFQARRLEAMDWIVGTFRGNPLTEKRSFHLPELADFSDRARTLAHALDEFITLERHTELHEWKMVRHAAPERRVLMGETLLLRYREADQDPGSAERNRENLRRHRLKDRYEQAFRLEHPEAARVELTREQRNETQWSPEGLRVRLRLETEGLECSLEEALALHALEPGSHWVLFPRWTTDGRLPPEQRVAFTPTPKQMLWGTRAELVRVTLERGPEGRAASGFAEVELRESHGGEGRRGFAFGSISQPLVDGDLYTLDPCPNNWYGYWCAKVAEGLCALEAAGETERCTLYHRLSRPGEARAEWPPAAADGQRGFLAGLDALREAGELHDFEPGKREYISEHGDAPLLLVQGPPGTGKSYSTAFALLARLQGALAADQDFRALLSCKTHAATDVLLRNLVAVRDLLRGCRDRHPDLFARFFDERVLDAPLFRVEPRGPVPDGVTPLPKDDQKPKGEPKNADRLSRERWCLVASAPGGVYRMLKPSRKSGTLFDRAFIHCLVLDEASQMNLPEAIMAALPLLPTGQVIVVGDHRQMPPIVHHDWAAEPRRTFQEYRAYESLFQTLLPLGLPMIRFEESFRLHAEMAEFLRREVYRKDGIRFHSRRRQTLPALGHEDPFVTAVLCPDHPLTVVVHEEAESQTLNPFEQRLVAPVLEALADPERYGLEASEGLGVVVPHRAQRAALRAECPQLSIPRDGVEDASDAAADSAVDTVERFQGGERTVILVSATESDREYLLVSGKFLMDPRRLTVALSRARRKLILVASRSVFSLFSPDEETFLNSLLWKNLLRRTCTVPLWSGDREGVRVEVWGNQPREP